MTDADAPRFNHVALTVEEGLLDGTPRDQLLAFYGEVFGWKEVEGQRQDGARLVLQCHRFDQFVFLVGGRPLTRCAPLDHFGLSVATLAELEAIARRASAYREKDDRVEVIGPDVEEHGPVDIHFAYVRYLLPMMVEVQHFAMKFA